MQRSGRRQELSLFGSQSQVSVLRSSRARSRRPFTAQSSSKSSVSPYCALLLPIDTSTTSPFQSTSAGAQNGSASSQNQGECSTAGETGLQPRLVLPPRSMQSPRQLTSSLGARSLSQVICRLRPHLNDECTGDKVISMQNSTVTAVDPVKGSSLNFSFSSVYDERSSQVRLQR